MVNSLAQVLLQLRFDLHETVQADGNAGPMTGDRREAV